MTPEEGMWKQIEIYRQMTPQQRLQISFDLYEFTRTLVRQGVKHLITSATWPSAMRARLPVSSSSRRAPDPAERPTSQPAAEPSTSLTFEGS